MANLITLATFKTLAGITGIDDDSLITILLGYVDGAVRAYTKQYLDKQDIVTEYLSGNATPSLRLAEGPVRSITSIRVDAGGYWGDGSGAFPAINALTAGTQYAIDRERADQNGFSLTRRVFRIGGVWPEGHGNIKVVYSAGWAFGSAEVPKDIELAAALILGMFYGQAKQSMAHAPIQSESIGQYSYALAAIADVEEIPRQAKHILDRYRFEEL